MGDEDYDHNANRDTHGNSESNTRVTRADASTDARTDSNTRVTRADASTGTDIKSIPGADRSGLLPAFEKRDHHVLEGSYVESVHAELRGKRVLCRVRRK